MSDDAPRKHDQEKTEFPLLPLKNVVVFPRTIVNLTIGRSRSIHALNGAVDGDRCLVVVAQRAGERDEAHSPDDLHPIGTLVEVRQVRRQADSTLQVEVESLRRVRLGDIVQEDPHLRVQVEHITEVLTPGPETEMLMRQLIELFEQYATLNNKVPADAPDHIRSARQPGYMADLLAAHLLFDVQERQRVLEMTGQLDRLQHMAGVLANAVEILQTDQRIRDKVRASIDKNQREFYLREQIKAIHDELSGEGGNEIAELRDRIQAKGFPEEIEQRMLKEVNRLERMPSISPESTVLRNYIDSALALPWTERTEDRIDLPLAEQILEEDHYGLTPVKERILDFLAVRQLTLRRLAADEKAEGLNAKQNQQKAAKSKVQSPKSKVAEAPNPKFEIQNPKSQHQGSILCFVGPPGVGKTSLGQSIARAMNRKFVRLSLGGVHDESEIRGHRRTYVGAMPGRIIQAMRTAGTCNPVMLMDEVDKMTSDMRGDPAAALLEVLDPAQNHAFVDHYMDLPYNLSDVLFIATANTLHSIPRALRDRMEVIEIGGYTEEEKVQIARRHLLLKQTEAHGLEPGFLEVPDRMLRAIIRTYTREAGVRELERKLATVCRKAARKVVQGRTTRVRVSSHNLEEFLGQPRYRYDVESRQDQVGVAIGLAWTEHGGELLPVEVAVMPGRGTLTITGRLGDVMQESARAALSYAKSRAAQLHIDLESLEKSDLHIHLPEGAIPKDGPSAGITMAVALISAITRRLVCCDIGMTGEITLTGRVLPIGGLKEKVLAAHRGGLKRMIAPMPNKPDWHELPPTVRREMEFTWVENMDQVIAFALRPEETGLQEPAVPVATRPEGTQSDRPGDMDVSTPVLNDPSHMPAHLTSSE
jgi:ATP-dependent Lon protease